jgi:hypothetical protein
MQPNLETTVPQFDLLDVAGLQEVQQGGKRLPERIEGLLAHTYSLGGNV